MTKSKSKNTTNAGSSVKSDAGTKKPTKANTILDLLKSKNGASTADMMQATGWQAHSVRGFLSGTVKKRMCLAIENEPDEDGVRRYRIIEPADAPSGQ